MDDCDTCRTWDFRIKPPLVAQYQLAKDRFEELCPGFWGDFAWPDDLEEASESVKFCLDVQEQMMQHSQVCAACPAACEVVLWKQRMEDSFEPKVRLFSWHCWLAKTLRHSFNYLLAKPSPSYLCLCHDFQEYYP